MKPIALKALGSPQQYLTRPSGKAGRKESSGEEAGGEEGSREEARREEAERQAMIRIVTLSAFPPDVVDFIAARKGGQP